MSPARPVHEPRAPRLWLALALAAALPLAASCAGKAPPSSLMGAAERPAAAADENAERWGVRIESLRTTAAGHMLDLRYRVIDVQKARVIINEHLKPRLILENDGRVLEPPTTPKVGALRQAPSEPELGRVYFALFGNPGALVKAGATVRVVLGQLEQDVPVE